MKSQIRTIPHRRKRQGKTDYKSRLSLIKSKKHRFVVRKSLKQMIIQAIEYSPKGDNVLFTITSSDLKKLGWKNSTSNIPSAYLTGLLAGKKAKEMKIKEGIFDLGINLSIKGTRIYSALKGLIDYGIKIPFSESIFPSEDRILGKHISNYKKIDIEKDFNEIKNKIMA
jgi:large subunit ribosomal protein L18